MSPFLPVKFSRIWRFRFQLNRLVDQSYAGLPSCPSQYPLGSEQIPRFPYYWEKRCWSHRCLPRLYRQGAGQRAEVSTKVLLQVFKTSQRHHVCQPCGSLSLASTPWCYAEGLEVCYCQLHKLGLRLLQCVQCDVKDQRAWFLDACRYVVYLYCTTNRPEQFSHYSLINQVDFNDLQLIFLLLFKIYLRWLHLWIWNKRVSRPYDYCASC